MKRFVLPAISLLALLVRPAPAQQGQLDASRSLFTVEAALNMAGYDVDLESPYNSPLRKAVRAELAKKEIPSLDAIKEFVARHHKLTPADELSQYVSFALTAGPPPDFLIHMRDVDIPPEVLPLRDFSPLMASFYKEANIEDLWKRAQPRIDQMIAPYHDGVLQAVLQVNSYLRQLTSGFKGRNFQIFLDPLSAPLQMNTRSYGNDYTVVIAAAPKPRINEVRHAYLYYLLDPLATRYEEILLRKKPLADHAQRAKLLGDAYKQDFLLLTTGSLVRAVEARLDKTPGSVQQALREGYILTPYFYEALPLYEKQEQSMLQYYKEMVQDIDVYHEDQRLVPVDFARQMPAAEPVAPPDLKAVTLPVYASLSTAEDLFKKQDYQKAEPLFQDAARQTTDKRAQAAGYYGLARIALAQGEAEDSEALLEQALELEPEAQIKAWALVYLGKLRLEVMDKEQAAKYFQDALQVEGGSDAARTEARQGLQKVQNSKQN